MRPGPGTALLGLWQKSSGRCFSAVSLRVPFINPVQCSSTRSLAVNVCLSLVPRKMLSGPMNLYAFCLEGISEISQCPFHLPHWHKLGAKCIAQVLSAPLRCLEHPSFHSLYMISVLTYSYTTCFTWLPEVHSVGKAYIEQGFFFFLVCLPT